MSLPDAVDLVVEYLRAQEHLAEVAVSAGRPEHLVAGAPALIVERIADVPPSRLPWARTRRTKLGIQAWVTAEGAAALRVLHGALAALYAARAVTMPGGGRIERVAALGDPTEVPDTDTGTGAGVHRAVATIEVTVR